MPLKFQPLRPFDERRRKTTREAVTEEVRKRKRAEARVQQTLALLQRHQKELRALAGRLITIQEEERRRLSRELHDEANQKLAMLAFDVDRLSQQLPPDPEEVRGELRLLLERISKLAGDIRGLAHHLHPSILDHLGVVSAIHAYIDEFGKREGIKLSFEAKNVPSSLPREVAVCLYRVTQECLGNVAKHAQADEASITLTGLSKSVRLSIRDSGVGFDFDQVLRGKAGLGLVSIKERMRLLHGRVVVKSSPGAGTHVIARIPLTRSAT